MSVNYTKKLMNSIAIEWQWKGVPLLSCEEIRITWLESREFIEV